ncbi:MAG: AbrB family transcriptional regulator [Methylocystaceae bacterium]|nr:MAG: AbrB family transcriptional regulator [Methylocystaceae bacterium]
MRVAKWGNSLAVRLPAKLVEELGVKEGDEVSLTAKGEATIEIETSQRPTAEELLARMRKFRGLIPADYKFKREDAYDED